MLSIRFVRGRVHEAQRWYLADLEQVRSELFFRIPQSSYLFWLPALDLVPCHDIVPAIAFYG